MRLLYYLNLFIVCCSSFIIQPSYLPIKFKPSNISYDIKYKNLKLKLQQKQLMINNFINLKKNNDDYDNEEKNKKINRLIVNIIYNIILYSYISYYIATHNP